jgi:STAS-like domain of unknown function (DUF4325)
MTTIDVGRDFSRFPSGRYAAKGSTSGEAFRNNLLVPALRKNNDKIQVLLDGTVGYGSSFLDEAFGGLVRIGFDPAILLTRIDLITLDGSLKDEIHEYISMVAVN